MAEAILGPLVGKLQELALSEAKALVAVNGDIRGLRDRLMWMQAFLRHADPRRRDTADELMRVWLKQTRDVAFDAEDAIDLYFLKLDLSRYPGWTRSTVKFFARFTTQISVRHDLSRKITEINTRLEDIINNKEKYKIEIAANNYAISQWKPSTIISTVVTNLDDVQPPPIKREEQEKMLEKALQDTKKDRVVIFVTGESGVGKTTLVREVYERSTTKTQFHFHVWASFPPYLSSSNILQLIYQQLSKKGTWPSRKDVDKKVQGKLENKEFLLVIDGEVSSTDWNAILAALPEEGQGSRGRIIRIMHGKRPSGSVSQLQIELSRFGKAKTNDLFKQMVNMEEKVEVLTTEVSWNSTKIDEMAVENQLDRKQTDEKLGIADVIHDITRGLPLAVVLLYGLVITKEYPNEWKAVFEYLKSKESKAKRLDSLLTMCFDDLPHDLKSCFLYFAALPMNAPIEARKLVCMWMAEGFLRPKDGKTMEKVGRIYLKELIARNLVKFVKMDNISGDDEFVAVHHKVHAFLQLEAQEANFVDIHNGDDIPSLTTARRLSLQNYTDKYAALANSLPKLRSILSNFQEEVEDDVEDKEEDEDDEEDEDEDEDEDEEEDGEEEEQVGRDGSQKEEAEQREEGDGDGKGERDGEQNVEKEIAEEENTENKGDGDNEQQVRNEEDKIVEAVLNDSSEQEKKEMKPGAMPWSGLLRCWGQGANTQNSIKSYIRGMLQQSKFLRVINLQGVEIGDEMPPTIGNVAHLQYLGVTACSLTRIPSTIGKLKNLQTLDVRDTYVEKLPTEFWKIRTLRHVFGSALFLPNRLGDLKHLQTLETVQPDEKNGWDSKTFERMVHLRSLQIWDPSKNSANAKALSAAIEKSDFLQYLEIMILCFDHNIIPMSVFASPSQRRLRALTLGGKLDMLPKDSKFCVPNLTFLSLENTEVSQDFIDKLAKLPLLANLILDTKSYKDDQGQLVFRAGGFKSLIKLTLSDLDLKKLKIGKSALPELTDLVIVWYPEDISIEVYGEHGFVKKIQDEDEELYGCITQVPIAPKKTGSIKQRVAGGTPQVN